MLLAMTPSNEDTTISRKPKDQFIDGVFNFFLLTYLNIFANLKKKRFGFNF